MTTNAEALAATLEGLPKALDCCAAAEELRRLSAVEAQRDALKAALKEVLAWGTDENYERAKAACEAARALLKDHP